VELVELIFSFYEVNSKNAEFYCFFYEPFAESAEPNAELLRHGLHKLLRRLQPVLRWVNIVLISVFILTKNPYLSSLIQTRSSGNFVHKISLTI